MRILIDNGHGEETKGKRSPDGRLREYAYAREIARRVKEELTELGYFVELIVPEECDVSITERCRRVNNICDKHGASNCLLVSIHNDAAGSGARWMQARGWSAFVAKNASVKSKTLARCLIDAADSQGLKVRRYAHQMPYWTKNLGICRDTKCPAVLTENLFQDNKEDVAYLLSEEGKKTITDIHVQGIIRYIKG